MRGSIDGLESSAPIGGMLPAVFADDDLALRFVAGLDEVVAPILLALDCLHTYFDPALAPADFARWLGTWVGAEVDGTEPDARLRAAVAAAAYLHRVRGTRRGLRSPRAGCGEPPTPPARPPREAAAGSAGVAPT
ncbi:phage tail protein, partial [Streptomyces mirabilis]